MRFHSISFKFVSSVFLLVCALNLTQCGSRNPVLTDRLDYSSDSLWYKGFPAVKYDVDLFYILPTCVWDWEDPSGVTHHHANVYDSLQRSAMDYSYDLAQTIFAEGIANYYAPYYRQTTLDSWIAGEEVSNERFAKAMTDVRDAFDYYLQQNNNRPFVLAGFSQGGKAVVELLKTLDDATRSRLIAAYVVGYKVTDDDLRACPAIKPATNDSESGVVICYNSVESTASIAPVLSPSALCINPVNWRTDAVEARLNDTITVAVDTLSRVLIVRGLDSEQCYLPALGALFKKGNYHLQELSLYQEPLHQNVRLRIRSYRASR